MKKIKLLLLTVFYPAFIFAQGGVELVPFAGYMFGGSVNYYEGKLKVQNGLNYGLSVLVPVQSLVDLEINYTRMDKVTAKFEPYYGYPAYNPDEFDVVTNYFQIGGISQFYTNNSMVKPFGSVSLGATWFDPSANENSTYSN